MADGASEDEIVELPIDGVLDLHTFRPGDVKELLPAYFAECTQRRIFEVRVIHGKGTGQLRRLVESVLQRDPQVAGFRAARPEEGGWGATIVTLKETP